MSKREMIKNLIAGEKVEHCGFWLGNPHSETWPVLHRYFGTSSEQELRRKLGDDVSWICPQFYADVYRNPEGHKLFDAGLDREEHGSVGPLANCEDLAQVENYPWPNPEYLRFDSCIVRMYSNPHIVRAVTDRVCEFYYQANEMFFAAAGGLVDGFFFGNDFGTQSGLICGPKQFDEFIMPWLGRFVEQGHRHGYQVILHSCGSIHGVIERLIEAGVDCLHPIQAKARDMDAERLAADFKGRIAFMGGIDSQGLMTNGSPDEIRADVYRVMKNLGPNLIVSPSHEAILPNVPPENVEALAQAVKGENKQ